MSNAVKTDEIIFNFFLQICNEKNDMLQTYEVGAITGDFILYEKEID